MMKNINWGIIGLGNIANKFAQDLLLVDDAVLYGVASRDLAKSKSFAQKYNATKYFDSYEDLAHDPLVDIIYIATPHTFHFANTLLCLKHGKAVLCEKPLGMNSWDVGTLISEAKRKNVFLMEALWTRFIPGTVKLLEILEEDPIGEIEFIEADFGFIGNTNPIARVYNRALGGGSLMDVGIYPIYLCLLLMGVPTSIKANASFTATKVDSSCEIQFSYSPGQKATLKSSIVANTAIEAMIYGKNGSIKLHKRFHHTKRITVSKKGTPGITFNIEYIGNGYYHEIVDVMYCLRNKKLENEKMSHSMSTNLINTLDRVRQLIGLTYESDKRKID